MVTTERFSGLIWSPAEASVYSEQVPGGSCRCSHVSGGGTDFGGRLRVGVAWKDSDASQQRLRCIDLSLEYFDPIKIERPVKVVSGGTKTDTRLLHISNLNVRES
jgi:hypothetical protein